MRLLVTGGLGFIGSCLVRAALKARSGWRVVNLDKRTYAGNLENLAPLAELGLDWRKPSPAASAWKGPRYRWVQADIADAKTVRAAMAGADAVVHLAAETHVDRSILSSGGFIRTNVLGTHVLLEAAREARISKFVHVGTDEVYGSLELGGEAKEDWPLKPRSPYSSSKAAADLLALSYFSTYGLPVAVARASNNFGPYQFPEKALPLLITNALEGKPYPLYGDGLQVRDWLYVEDHVDALLLLLEKGSAGEVYNVGGSHSETNLEIVRKVLSLMGKSESLVQRVADRPGHDRRYALDSSKLERLGRGPRRAFDDALRATIEWYVANEAWWRKLKGSTSFRDYYRKQYGKRLVRGAA